MLVLSRKKGERICVGSDVIVTVLKVSGHTVKIGVQAPDGVQILRAELVQDNPPSDAGADDGTPPKATGANRCDRGDGRERNACDAEAVGDDPAPDPGSAGGRTLVSSFRTRIELRDADRCLATGSGEVAYHGAGRTLAACR